MSVVGGNLMLRIGYRPTVIAGLTLMTAGFAVLSFIGPGSPRWLLLVDVGIMGAGMGLVMLVLLITMQSSVERNHLGIATSLNQFSRSIGATVGVAVMGAVMSISLNAHLSDIQQESGLSEAEVTRVVHNLNALLQAETRDQLPPAIIKPLETTLAGALHNAFLLGGVLAALALISAFWLPSKMSRVSAKTERVASTPAECERLLMAEMTTIDAEHEPSAIEPEATVGHD
jgi:MFS family permease